MPVPLRIDERSVDSLVVLHLDGHFVFDEGDRMLRDRVTSLVNAGARLLLIDLHDVSYIDSGGIGALAQMHLDVANRGGRLALLCPSTCANRVLRITHVSAVFEIFQDEAQALHSMTGAPPLRAGAAVGRAS
jgi:anti-sigma B factor antagonist